MGKIVAAARIAASVPGAASRKDAPVHRPRIPKDPAAAASRRCIASAGGGGNRPSFRPLGLEEAAPLVAEFYARRAGRSRHENIISSANTLLVAPLSNSRTISYLPMRFTVSDATDAKRPFLRFLARVACCGFFTFFAIPA